VKYLNALLQESEKTSPPRGEEPTKPTKPVLSVSSGAQGRDSGKISAPDVPPASQAEGSCESRNPPEEEVGCRTRYRQIAEAMEADCWALDSGWLLNHPKFYQRLKALDLLLDAIERQGASGEAYQRALDRLMECVRDARAAYEREREQACTAVQ
jgi:hypothetical protein